MSILDDKITRFKSDVEIAHQIIHGDSTTSVETEGGWVDSFAKVLEDNKRVLEEFLDPHVKYVSMEPVPGQYSSIAAAVESITDATATKPYLITVMPGVYSEPPIQMKEHVHVRGSGQDVTFIKPTVQSEHFIRGANNAAVTDASVFGPSGFDKSIFCMDEKQGLTNQLFRVERIVFGAADTLAHVHSGFIAVTASTIGEKSSFRRGFVAQDDGVHDARIAIRNVNSNGMTAPFPETLCLADGTRSQILVLSSMARASTNISAGSGVGVGIHLRNGGRYRVVGGSLIGFGKGIWAENVGAAPTLECVGINLMGNVQDILIEHPGTKGSLQGSARRSGVTVNPEAVNLSLFYTDQDGHGLVNVGPLYVGKTHSTTSNIQPVLSRGMRLGLLDGGELTKGVGLQAHAAGGMGYVRIDGWLRQVIWNAATLSLVANQAPYVYVDAEGVVKTSVALPDSTRNIILGRLITNLTEVLMIGPIGSSNIETFGTNLDNLLKLAFGPVYISGSIVTKNAGTPRAIDVSAGHYFYSTMERRPAAVVKPQMLAVHQSASGFASEYWTEFDNSHYHQGAAEIALSPGYFAKHTLYTNNDGAKVGFIVAHATAQYATLQEAIAAPNPTPLIAPEGSPLIAAIIVQQGNNQIVEILDQRPRLGAAMVGGAHQATRHGDLLDLNEDHHTQYLRADGSREMSGPLDMGGNGLENVTSINGLDLTRHAGRHAPNGVDPLPTAAGVTLNASSSNSEGVANSLARSDHSHKIEGFQPLSTNLTRFAALTGTGIPKRALDGTWTIAGLAASEIPNLDWSKITTGKPTTLAGYGITDVVPSNIAHMYKGSVSIMSGSTTIGMSNSAPAATQGTQLFSRTITPRDAQSSFMISFHGFADANIGSNTNNSRTATVFATLFRSINGGAWTYVGSGAASISLSNNPNALCFDLEDTPNTALPVTYMARIGSDGAAWYLGRTVSYTLGNVNDSGYRITEVRP